MKLYEAMVVVDDARCSDDYSSVAEHVKGILRKSGAEIKQFTKWDERRLAYPINRHGRGVYLLVYFMAPLDSITQINRDCALSDVVLRMLITVPTNADTERVLAAPEEKPAAEDVQAPAEEAKEEAAGDEAAAEEAAGDEEAPAEVPEEEASGETAEEEPAPAEQDSPEGQDEEEKPVGDEAGQPEEEEKPAGAEAPADEQASDDEE